MSLVSVLRADKRSCGLVEAPATKRQPSVHVWLTQMERYMRLMKYSPSDWLDIVAMMVEGAASSWVNAVL